MKKLLTVLVVSGLCGTSSASIVSLVGEGTTIAATPGSTVKLEIQTDKCLHGLDAAFTITGGDVFIRALDTAVAADAAAYGWDPTLPVSPLGVGTVVVEIGGGSFNPNAGNPYVGYVDIAYTGGTQVVSLIEGLAFGGSYDIDFGTPTFSTGVVTIVPEPMTIALLGLGGLFLRRRK